MRFERYKITRDGNTVHNKPVSAWELPLIQYVFEHGNVVPTGKFEEADGQGFPDPAAEFNRLGDRYGKDADGQAIVEIVYGQGRIGVRELGKVIAEAQAAEKAESKPTKAASAKKSGKRRASAETDSLLS